MPLLDKIKRNDSMRQISTMMEKLQRPSMTEETSGFEKMRDIIVEAEDVIKTAFDNMYSSESTLATSASVKSEVSSEVSVKSEVSMKSGYVNHAMDDLSISSVDVDTPIKNTADKEVQTETETLALDLGHIIEKIVAENNKEIQGMFEYYLKQQNKSCCYHCNIL